MKKINILFMSAAMIAVLCCSDPIKPEDPTVDPGNQEQPEQPSKPQPGTDFESQFEKHIAL